MVPPRGEYVPQVVPGPCHGDRGTYHVKIYSRKEKFYGILSSDAGGKREGQNHGSC